MRDAHHIVFLCIYLLWIAEGDCSFSVGQRDRGNSTDQRERERIVLDTRSDPPAIIARTREEKTIRRMPKSYR